MNKDERQSLIQELVENEVIQKQSKIVELIEERGYSITQATISRDIQDMQLIKIPYEGGGYRYTLPREEGKDYYREIEKILEGSFVDIEIQDNLVNIKTTPGSGHALGEKIEMNNLEEVFALVINDASVLLICRSEKEAEILRNRFLHFM